MEDDRTLKDERDRSLINLSQDYEVRYWTQKFGVTGADLRDAIKKIGNSAEAVEKKSWPADARIPTMIERDKSERRVDKPTEEKAGVYPMRAAPGSPADEDEKPERDLVHLAEPTLWVTDAELIRRIGVPAKIAREAIRTLDRNPTRTSLRSRRSGATAATGRRLEHGSIGPTGPERCADDFALSSPTGPR